MKVHVINHMRLGVQVHRVGCADIARVIAKRQTNSDYLVDVPAGMTPLDAVVADLNDSFAWSPDSGEPAPWSAAHVTLLPCVKKVGQ